MPEPIPDPDWAEPKWLKVFNRRELAWLAFRLDSSNRELRITCRQLTEQLRRTTSNTEQETP